MTLREVVARAVAAQQRGADDEAIAGYQAAIARGVRDAGVFANLGEVLGRAGRGDEALAAYEEALRCAPDRAEIHNNYAALLVRLGQPVRAESAAAAALRLRPDYAIAHFNHGNALADQARYREAVAAFEHAIGLVPDFVDAHINLGCARLALGDFAAGWEHYAWSRRHPDRREQYRYLERRPLWDGTPFPGQTLLIARDGGHGDFLQFARFFAAAQALGGATAVECAPEMLDLAASIAGISELVPSRGEQPRTGADHYLPLLDLPRVLGVDAAQLAARPPGPYVRAPQEARERWRRQLAGETRFRIGIAWAGNARNTDDRRRSAPFACFEPLVRLPGIAWYSLQAGPRAGDPPADLPLVRPALTTFGETAAIVEHLDLVISVDTAVAHLAGALDRPVWLALAEVADWRWLAGREDSPWYPSMRLFRQARRDDWAELADRLAAAVREAATAARRDTIPH